MILISFSSYNEEYRLAHTVFIIGTEPDKRSVHHIGRNAGLVIRFSLSKNIFHHQEYLINEIIRISSEITDHTSEPKSGNSQSSGITIFTAFFSKAVYWNSVTINSAWVWMNLSEKDKGLKRIDQCLPCEWKFFSLIFSSSHRNLIVRTGISNLKLRLYHAHTDV